MSRKLVLAMTLTIFLIGMLGVALKVQMVEASGTITINADGSVEGTTDISTVDNVTYTFTDNINDSIVVERDNIVVDGANYTVQGPGSGTGINLTDRSNVTIKNMEIKTFDRGIWLDESSNNTISKNNITNNNDDGIYITSSSNNNTISGNTVTANNDDGIRLSWSSNNTLSGNNASSNKNDGISLSVSSDNNVLSGNTVSSNKNNGIRLRSSSNNNFTGNNFIDNKQQVYDYSWDNPATPPSINIWDDGAGKGNYWSDYEEKYPNATEMDGSGIWDTAYDIDENNQDNYPLVPEFPSFLILPLFMIATLLAVIAYRRQLKKVNVNT